MAEAFVKTLKRDYVRANPTPDPRTVIEQLPASLAHYNEAHSHKALGYRSPREYITQTREAPSGIRGQQQVTQLLLTETAVWQASMIRSLHAAR